MKSEMLVWVTTPLIRSIKPKSLWTIFRVSISLICDSVPRKKVLMDQMGHFGVSPVFASIGLTS